MTQIEITPAELPYHEWIGLLVKVDSSCDPTINGLSGLVIDETRNTIIIETVSDLTSESGLIKTVPKKGTVFVFTLPERISQSGRISVKDENIEHDWSPLRAAQTVQIDGNITLSQPQNRIKNLKKSRK